MERLIIRVDASTQIGTGHLMRCLALAQAWKDAGGQVIFITACQSEGLLQRLREEEFDTHLLACPHPDPGDWDYTKDILTAHPDAWIALDGYHFDEVYQQRVKEAGHRLLVIDDMAHLKHYYADIILNQNLHAEQLHYSCEPYTRLLLGTRYVLLRREFLGWGGWKREIPEIARRVLVTLGGSDPENHTLKVIQALQEVDIPALEATVVIGLSNPHADALEAAIKQSNIPIRLVRNVKNMPELMSWADAVVSSAGSTVWELMFMGLPGLVIVTAQNQINVGKEVERAGVLQDLGWFAELSRGRIGAKLRELLADAEGRRVMSTQGRELVDGHGARRVCAALVTEGLYLRPVSRADSRLLWSWANDPVARRMALNTAQIPFEDHMRWLEKQFASDNTMILILERDAVPVGQIRFDLDECGNAAIDIYVVPEYRGHSLGSYLLREGTRRYLELNEKRVKAIVGHVRPENIPSYSAFEKAGFERRGTDTVDGILLERFVWPKGKVR